MSHPDCPETVYPPQFGPLIPHELAVLTQLQPRLAAGEPLAIIELGCGAARLARHLLHTYPNCQVTGLEVDARQHAKNLAEPQQGLAFLAAEAQHIPLPANSFDLALMLKSLHHVPLPHLAQALDEVARVLRPGGYLYVSEPVYDGALNEVIRLFNDEGVVRAAAQAALDAAVASGRWVETAQVCFQQSVRFNNLADFEQRMMFPTFADHPITPAIQQAVAAALTPHWGPQGASFSRPMRVRLLQRL